MRSLNRSLIRSLKASVILLVFWLRYSAVFTIKQTALSSLSVNLVKSLL